MPRPSMLYLKAHCLQHRVGDQSQLTVFVVRMVLGLGSRVLYKWQHQSSVKDVIRIKFQNNGYVYYVQSDNTCYKANIQHESFLLSFLIQRHSHMHSEDILPVHDIFPTRKSFNFNLPYRPNKQLKHKTLFSFLFLTYCNHLIANMVYNSFRHG